LLVIILVTTVSTGLWTWKNITAPETLSIEFINITLVQNPDIGEINEIIVTIRNTGLYLIIPRFGIYRNFIFSNPVYWNISEGPEILHPNTVGTYRIRTEVPEYFIRDKDVVTIIVNDVRNPNIFRLSPQIVVNVTDTKGIKNGSFRYWMVDMSLGFKVPYKWNLLLKKSLDDSFQIDSSSIGEKTCLMLQVYQDGKKEGGVEFGKFIREEEWAHIGVIQRVSPFFTLSFYIFPTFNSMRGIVESGIRISDGEYHNIVILFSGEVPNKQYKYFSYSTGLQEIVLILPTRLNTWNYYEINMTETWGYLEWEFPKEFYVELYVAAHYTKPGKYVVYFTEISTTSVYLPSS